MSKVIQFQITENSSEWQGKTVVLMDDGNLYTHEITGVGSGEYIEAFVQFSPPNICHSMEEYKELVEKREKCLTV